jgi:hypothetical protein
MMTGPRSSISGGALAHHPVGHSRPPLKPPTVHRRFAALNSWLAAVLVLATQSLQAFEAG